MNRIKWQKPETETVNKGHQYKKKNRKRESERTEQNRMKKKINYVNISAIIIHHDVCSANCEMLQTNFSNIQTKTR